MSTIPARPISLATAAVKDAEPEPTWEIAYLFPRQGMWTEQEYLALDTNRLVELVDGKVELLPIPTEKHQMIVLLLCQALIDWAGPRDAGKVLFSGLRVRMRALNIREPDVVFMRTENFHRRHDDAWDGADLTMEVVSPDDPDRDVVTKRTEYARARIPEYWIVDPRAEQITVLKLVDETYAEHGVFSRGQRATAATLDGFSSIDVAAVFDVH
jgi:Uma2 family endonuclease